MYYGGYPTKTYILDGEIDYSIYDLGWNQSYYMEKNILMLLKMREGRSYRSRRMYMEAKESK